MTLKSNDPFDIWLANNREELTKQYPDCYIAINTETFAIMAVGKNDSDFGHALKNMKNDKIVTIYLGLQHVKA